MDNIRCDKCNKLLLKKSKEFYGIIEIKCPKCKQLKLYKTEVQVTTETQRKAIKTA